ncbi:MAG: TIR domain-containing protein [Chitinophagaceae bacterium]
MRLLSEIVLPLATGKASIQLLQGDLSTIPKEHEADILVISAFPNDYTPLPGSLLNALGEKGLNVAEMATHKAVDMVQSTGCWLSEPLSAAQQEQFNFRQILCFEPRRDAGTPDQVVGNIFRCINNFAFDDDNNVVAMQVLATGRQKMPVEKMLPAMIDASIFWLESGIPLDVIKFVVHRDEVVPVALSEFNKEKVQYEARTSAAKTAPAGKTTKAAKKAPPPKNSGVLTGGYGGTMVIKEEIEKYESRAGRNAGAAAPASAAPMSPAPAQTAAPVAATEYDFFISYSHEHTPQVAELVTAMKAQNSAWNIFYDKSSIPTGGLWIKMISDAIQRAKYVVCILSPQYRDSPVCWDEFQCAKAKEYRTKKPVIKTINLFKDDEMPLIMSVYSYVDCTEGDIQKLKDAIKVFAAP